METSSQRETALTFECEHRSMRGASKTYVDPAVADPKDHACPALRRALPAIEALTLALPPSGGPGFDVGAQKTRA
jgi:hypothetical protein